MKGNRRVLEEIRERLFGAFAFGNVPCNLRCGNDPPARVLDGRDRQGNLDQLSILVPPYRLIVIDALAAPDPFQYPRFFVVPVRGNKQCDVLADDFVPCVTEDLLRLAVPARDDAVQGLAHNRVVRGGNDCSKASAGFLRLFTCCDVLEGQQDAALGLARKRQQTGVNNKRAPSGIWEEVIDLDWLERAAASKHLIQFHAQLGDVESTLRQLIKGDPLCLIARGTEHRVKSSVARLNS